MHRSIPILAYSGLIPFAFSAALIPADVNLLGIDPIYLFVSYSGVILSFVGGGLWGRSLLTPISKLLMVMLVASNIAALIAWFALLLAERFYA